MLLLCVQVPIRRINQDRKVIRERAAASIFCSQPPRQVASSAYRNSCSKKALIPSPNRLHADTLSKTLQNGGISELRTRAAMMLYAGFADPWLLLNFWLWRIVFHRVAAMWSHRESYPGTLPHANSLECGGMKKVIGPGAHLGIASSPTRLRERGALANGLTNGEL